ncbi:hypothetical protein [Pseudomonas luteola]|uniref:hypothetical protein n=1 Tax=Pseudomonas luteola TaxID=47886 RepID=UPI000F7A1321|nr:hypothetical protein [Pseudomonas luteola]RRW44219.1 hypothetical protein EGJ50_17070 [Pseudomonas luteola]
MPLPQTVSNSVVDMINALGDKAKPEDIRVPRIRREIESLKKVDAAKAFMLSGMLNATLYDYKASIEDHEASIRRAPGNYIYLTNYAISLKKFNCFNESLDKLLEAFKANYGSIEILETAISMVFVSGGFEQINYMLEACIKAHPEKDIRATRDVLRMYEYFLASLSKLEITREKYQIATEHVISILNRNKGVAFDIGSVAEHFFDEDSYLFVELSVDVPGNMLAEMNEQLAELIITDERLNSCWDKIIFNFCASDKQGVNKFAA